MSNGEKHHYIPKFYLKQWTGIDRRLCEYSRPFDRMKTYRRYPSETAYEYGLTTLTTYPDPVSEIVERKLMQAIDSSAANALRFLGTSFAGPRKQQSQWAAAHQHALDGRAFHKHAS
jgi:Protein of unknown function (DUF4238)